MIDVLKLARPEIVALSKCDALDEATLSEKYEELKKAARKRPLMLSAVSGEGVKEALFALAREIAKKDAEEEAQNPEANEPWQP